MKRVLTIYPNCSLGGMTSVYTSRFMIEPDTFFDFLFLHDKGGRGAFDNHVNVDYRIVRKDRLDTFYGNVLTHKKYDEIRITSLASLTQLDLEENKNSKLIYEFHTSTISVIEGEIKLLDFSKITEVWVPSEYLREIVKSLVSADVEIKVTPNIVNTKVFHPIQNTSKKFFLPKESIPIFWVGRLDKGKNYKDFFRALALLPDRYVGTVILSLENEPTRISEAILEADRYGITKRIRFLLNLTQDELAEIYRNAFENKGIYCSTSLAESFGYGVLEAALSGLPVVTYAVGGITGHKKYGFAMHMVDAGDTIQLVQSIMDIDWLADYETNICAREKYLSKLF